MNKHFSHWLPLVLTKRRRNKDLFVKIIFKMKIVYYDLETSGGRSHEIIQIAARYNYQEFNQYILPDGPISSFVTNNIHGIYEDCGELVCQGEYLESSSPYYGLESFIDFLDEISYIGSRRRVVLCAHNNKNFDSVRKFN